MGSITGALALGIWSNELIARQEAAEGLSLLQQMSLSEAVEQEELWKMVQMAYTNSASFINLNNGGVSPQPKSVQEAEIRYLELSNEIPSYYMWRLLAKDLEIIRKRLAKLGGCSAEEIAFNRNTTEGIQTVISGIDWKKGDELIVTEQDYSTVKAGWDILARRYQVKIVKLDLKLPFEEEDYYVNSFLGAISSKTRFINLTQIINWSGQVVPVSAIRRICEVARQKGIFTLVDGAHSFAQIDFKIPDLGCDAYATSLHKWLSAPFGNGFLYVRKEMIPTLWSLFPCEEKQEKDIRKFEHWGTRSIGNMSAIGNAIDFHNLMGIQLKEARLRYLKDYWVNQIKDLDRIQIFNSSKPEYTAAIALFGIDGLEPQDIEFDLFNKFRIHSTNINLGELKGIRISPNVYTTLEHLDQLVEGIAYVLKNK